MRRRTDQPHVNVTNAVRRRAPGEIATQDEVDLYVRTYSTVLRSSGFIKLRALVPAHLGVRSSLHGDGASTAPDAGAFIYAIHRLPAIIRDVECIVLGQLPEQFNRVVGRPIESWTKVSAPARRRVWHYDGESTLAVHIASPSDLDDVVPTLVAYEIEWNKLHALLNADPESLELLRLPAEPDGDRVAALGERLGFSADDWLP
ncbi:MAG: hypothetical protein HY329_24995 [Chloroflexi bacterium]|nr:hypothetical protein [Chloroflexota bacterium]